MDESLEQNKQLREDVETLRLQLAKSSEENQALRAAIEALKQQPAESQQKKLQPNDALETKEERTGIPAQMLSNALREHFPRHTTTPFFDKNGKNTNGIVNSLDMLVTREMPHVHVIPLEDIKLVIAKDKQLTAILQNPEAHLENKSPIATIIRDIAQYHHRSQPSSGLRRTT